MPRVEYERQPFASGGFQPSMRERPGTLHHSMHESREAEFTRQDDIHPEIDIERVFNPTSLRAPAPRNGYAQRWVADGTNPTADRSEQRNWFSKKQAGWSPRDPDTVPKHERHLYPGQKLGDHQMAIRIANQVLCEIPLEILRRRDVAVRQVIDKQSSSVPDSARMVRERGHRGASPMEVVDQTRSIRGRVAPALADADIRDIL
jgi:hypothetical protein